MKHLLALLLCLPVLTQAATLLEKTASPKIMTPNWATASALTDMGYPPLAMGDKRIYPIWSSEPVQPASVIDMGARYRPNRELLAQLPMNLILDNFFYHHLRAVYPKHIAVQDIEFDAGNTQPRQSWQTYVNATRQIGDTVGDTAAANAYLQGIEKRLVAYGANIRAAAPHIKSYAVVQFADARTLRIYAANSMFHVAFRLMGLQQSDLGIGNRWGNRQITLADLAKLPPDSCLLIIAPLHRMTEAELERSYIWNRIGFGKTRCVRKLPAVWLFGGPDSIAHFSRFLHTAMVPPHASRQP